MYTNKLKSANHLNYQILPRVRADPGGQGQEFWQQFRFASLKSELAQRILPNIEFSRKWPPSSMMTQMWGGATFRK